MNPNEILASVYERAAENMALVEGDNTHDKKRSDKWVGGCCGL